MEGIKLDSKDDKVRMEDVTLFAELLEKSRGLIGKARRQISRELGVDVSMIDSWERSITSPSENRLPAIAKAYGIPLEEVQRDLNVSKAARQMEKDLRKPP